MLYEQLSDDAKQTLKGMVEYCIERGLCMGMDEGIEVFADGDTKEVKHVFRNELEKFCGMQTASEKN